jgi:uncharacterized protein
MDKDRVGLGWRPELAAGIFEALDRIDILEVLGDNYLEASRDHKKGLKALARDVAVHVHSIDLGLAGSEHVDQARIDRLARLVHEIEPEAWSDHLAFVRAGDVEIGHLALPPRTEQSVAAAVRNIERAAAVIGSLPLMENIATLVEPPGSTLSEPDWINRIIRGSGCGLLLDVHNLYANAINFGFDPVAYLDEIPLDRVGAIHIAGGEVITSPDGTKQYLLDDHLHDVDRPVYDLLSEIAARIERPLTVILERDGAYPPMPDIMEELDRARDALKIGRARLTDRKKVAVHAN